MTERTGKKDDRIGIAIKTMTMMTMTTMTTMTMTTTETVGGGGIVTAMITGGGDAIASDEFIGDVCFAGSNRQTRQVKNQATP
jgi:hypothetical protein